MQLDFLTLYVVILLNSLTLTIIWAAFCYTYRGFRAAHYWLAATSLSTLGGLAFSLEGIGLGLAWAIVGNGLVVLGFCLSWTGVRTFHGEPPRWIAIALIMAATIAGTILAGTPRSHQNIGYAVSQMAPIALTMAFLMHHERRTLGALVAVCATGLALLGHGAEAIMNVLRLTGDLTMEGYYRVAAYALLAVVFGGGVWNIGFILMAFDRLRAELKTQAVQDDLTGLPNRRSLMETARRYEMLGERTRLGFSVLLIDFDRFKEINDCFGHAAGDACLKHFASLASRGLRKQDTLARLSGDEFCMVLPGIDLPEAGTVAGDLVARVAKEPCPWRAGEIDMTISVGIAEWWPEPSTSIARVLEEADIALYRTKRRGGNGYSLPGTPADDDSAPERPQITVVR